MDNIDRDLAPDELAFQCLALAEAALCSQDNAVKEVLLFVIREKAERLYSELAG